MAKARATRTSDLAQTIRKFVLSFAVVLTFIFYIVSERLGDTAEINAAAVHVTPGVVEARAAKPTPSDAARANQFSSPVPTRAEASGANTATALPRPAATATRVPSPTPRANGAFKDGEFIGDVKDAYFGNVQVKAIVQGGRVADVQFLDYPHDRRTSVRINDFAMPRLVTEAIQKQNATVDIISGATLTSDAFRRSLQSALNKASG